MDSFEFVLNIRFMRALTHCMVAERAETSLWELMRNRHVPASQLAALPLHLARPVDTYQWKGTVLRSLVEAQAHWSAPTHSLQDSIKSFLFALSIRRPFREGGDADFIPIAAAGLWVLKQIQRHENEDIPTELYETFMQTIPRWNTSEDQVAHRLAILKLAHPNGPQPLPALHFWETCAGATSHPSFTSDLLNPRSILAMTILWYDVVCTIQGLHRTRRITEARWVFDFASKRFGLVDGPQSAFRAIRDSTVKDPGPREVFRHEDPALRASRSNILDASGTSLGSPDAVHNKIWREAVKLKGKPG